MEYWIVYDVETGGERWRGSGTPGSAAQQQLPDGLAVVVVPQAAISGEMLNLDALRTMAAAGIDAQAEQVRMRFLTPGAGQAMTYARKEAEARAWTADATAAVPFLSAEAPARGMTIGDLAAEVIALSDAWTTIGSAIEGMRMGAKTAVATAPTLGAIVAAARVDWSVLDASAV